MGETYVTPLTKHRCTLNKISNYILVLPNLTLWIFEYYSHGFFTLVGLTTNLRNLNLFPYTERICNGHVYLLLRKSWILYRKCLNYNLSFQRRDQTWVCPREICVRQSNGAVSSPSNTVVPLSTIPPLLHTHTIVMRKTSGRSLGTSNKELFFRISRNTG